MKPIVKNVKSCVICEVGTVDRFPHHFECRDCGAIGDPFLGMMQPKSDLERNLLIDKT